MMTFPSRDLSAIPLTPQCHRPLTVVEGFLPSISGLGKGRPLESCSLLRTKSPHGAFIRNGKRLIPFPGFSAFRRTSQTGLLSVWDEVVMLRQTTKGHAILNLQFPNQRSAGLHTQPHHPIQERVTWGHQGVEQAAQCSLWRALYRKGPGLCSWAGNPVSGFYPLSAGLRDPSEWWSLCECSNKGNSQSQPEDDVAKEGLSRRCCLKIWHQRDVASQGRFTAGLPPACPWAPSSALLLPGCPPLRRMQS